MSGTGWFWFFFTRNGLKINLVITEVLHIGHLREELDSELEGKKLTQGDSFVYLGGAACGDGKTEIEAGANAWTIVEGVMANWRISKRLRGKVMSTYLCDTGMPVRNGNLGNDRTAATKAASVRKQLGTKKSKCNEVRQGVREEMGVKRSLTESEDGRRRGEG